MLKKLYDKSRLAFAIVWIVLYCVLMSAADMLSDTVGLSKSVSLPMALVLSGVLLLFIIRNRLQSEYGLKKASVSGGAMLYYIPIFVMLTANLWHGVALNEDALGIALYVLTMLCVGFLEEMIFRGLLFRAMRKDSLTAAVIVSSVTFGIGHIINLINGSGAELIPNILQVVYATAAGFMFVMIYLVSDSLILCAAAHGIFNSLSIIAKEPGSLDAQIISCVALSHITGLYALYLVFSFKRKGQDEDKKPK